MAKAQNKKVKAPSVHSRAARRATSPSIDVDKSLKEVQPPPGSVNHRPAVLGLHQSAGVTKKAKRGRKAVLSSRARRRHERGLERAEEIVDRTAQKVQRSKGSARKIQSRRKNWDEINSRIQEDVPAGGRGSANKFAGLADEDAGGDEAAEELDEDMGEADGKAAVAAVVDDQSVPPPAPQTEEVEDETL